MFDQIRMATKTKCLSPGCAQRDSNFKTMPFQMRTQKTRFSGSGGLSVTEKRHTVRAHVYRSLIH